MADSGTTPPPKDVVTTRTPTPTSPPADRPESVTKENAPDEVDQFVPETELGEGTGKSSSPIAAGTFYS